MEHYSGGRRTTARMAQDNTTLSEKSHTQRTSITWFLSHGIHRTGRKADTQSGRRDEGRWRGSGGPCFTDSLQRRHVLERADGGGRTTLGT